MVSGIGIDPANDDVYVSDGESQISRRPERLILFVVNGIDEQINFVDRSTGQALGSFGHPGRQVGELMHAHTINVDSKGNIHVGECVDGRRAYWFLALAFSSSVSAST